MASIPELVQLPVRMRFGDDAPAPVSQAKSTFGIWALVTLLASVATLYVLDDAKTKARRWR